MLIGRTINSSLKVCQLGLVSLQWFLLYTVWLRNVFVFQHPSAIGPYDFFYMFSWSHAWSLNLFPKVLILYMGRAAGFEPELVKLAALPRYQ
jgi:hypothetical protein